MKGGEGGWGVCRATASSRLPIASSPCSPPSLCPCEGEFKRGACSCARARMHELTHTHTCAGTSTYDNTNKTDGLNVEIYTHEKYAGRGKCATRASTVALTGGGLGRVSVAVFRKLYPSPDLLMIKFRHWLEVVDHETSVHQKKDEMPIRPSTRNHDAVVCVCVCVCARVCSTETF